MMKLKRVKVVVVQDHRKFFFESPKKTRNNSLFFVQFLVVRHRVAPLQLVPDQGVTRQDHIAHQVVAVDPEAHRG